MGGLRRNISKPLDSLSRTTFSQTWFRAAAPLPPNIPEGHTPSQDFGEFLDRRAHNFLDRPSRSFSRAPQAKTMVFGSWVASSADSGIMGWGGVVTPRVGPGCRVGPPGGPHCRGGPGSHVGPAGPFWGRFCSFGGCFWPFLSRFEPFSTCPRPWQPFHVCCHVPGRSTRSRPWPCSWLFLATV